MSVMLRDNTPVSQAGGGKALEDRCREIQRLVDSGDCSLIDLYQKKVGPKVEKPQIFKESNGTLFTWNFVGLFEYRTKDGAVETVIIGDRFGQNTVANGGAGGEFLSLFPWLMLEKCWDETPLWLLNESRAQGETDFFDQVLIFQLAAQLERAWKKGQLRLYRNFSRYDSRVRGQIDLPRKIRMSMGLEDGNMAYRVREYSEDNLYSQLFFQACLKAESRHPELMRQLKQRLPGFRMARQALERQNAAWVCRDTRSLLNGTRKKITNPLYRDYETLRGVARAVLRRTSSYPYSETGAPFVTGIFLNISTLWEDYLAKAVFQELPSQPQPQKTFGILEGLLNVRPDFWWRDERHILDAKYRPVWSKFLNPSPTEAKDREAIQNDVYQVLSYMLALDCTHGGVIFPVKSQRPGPAPVHRTLQAVRGRRGPAFWLLPFFVPQLADYDAFSSAMEAEARTVCQTVRDFLETP